MMLPIGLRSFVDHLLHEERQRIALDTRTEPPAHDLSALPTKLKLSSRERTVEQLSALVTVHVTDVRGGYGVSKRQLAAAAGSYERALLARYHGAAYHRLVSRRVGLVANHRLLLRTSHGHAGNRGAGWAIDCGHDEDLTAPEMDGFVLAAQQSLADLILDTYALTRKAVVVVPHRAFSAQRGHDTNRTVWRLVVRPTIDRIAEVYGPGIAYIDYELAEGSGRPITRSWDDRALYDDRGRRV